MTRPRAVPALLGLAGLAAASVAVAAQRARAVDPQRPPASLAPCPTHDPGAYHGLIDVRRRCRYDHEHKDDPNLLNGRFGRPGAWFGGTAISYPWQTFKGAGEGHPAAPAPGVFENELKHRGYSWGVRRGVRCVPASGAAGCLTDVRLQVHALPTSHDATTRFHSFSLEARGCIGKRCGTIREGGWIDYGKLRLDTNLPTEVAHVPLPGDPANQQSLNPVRHHKTVRTNQRDITWYTQGGLWNHHRSWPGLRFEGAAPIDPAEPARDLSYCEIDGRPRGACPDNGSWFEVHLVPIYITKDMDRLDRRIDGRVTFRGYTDRYGTIVRGCTAPGLDCVPIHIDRMPVGDYQYRDDAQGRRAIEHDVSPAGRRFAANGRIEPASRWWIAHPGLDTR